MYRKADQPKLTPENFELPKETKLLADNRWVIMAELIPWSEFEAEYAENFSETFLCASQTFSDGFGSINHSRKIRSN